MEWIVSTIELPDYQEFVLFCLNSDLKTTYVGWLENKQEIPFEEDMWFADGACEWFALDQILAWCKIPPCPIPHNRAAEDD